MVSDLTSKDIEALHNISERIGKALKGEMNVVYTRRHHIEFHEIALEKTAELDKERFEARIAELERLLAHARSTAAENLEAKRIAQDRYAELEKKQQLAATDAFRVGQAYHEQSKRMQAAEARVAELSGALEPFSDPEASLHPEYQDDQEVQVTVTVGDVRRALARLKRASGGGK